MQSTIQTWTEIPSRNQDRLARGRPQSDTLTLPNPELSLSLYKKLYLIREAEDSIGKHYFDDEMKTPMHMSAGAEHISAGICEALQESDQVFGTYRSHALYLAKTMETDLFFGELYGRATGCAGGIAGSMHLSLPRKGCMPCSAIVASNISVAAGAAFAHRAKKQGQVVVAFFGDGALEEGAFWESLNLVCMMRLPILFVCEDNGLAVHTFQTERQGFYSITDIVERFDIRVRESSTTDVETVNRLAQEAVTELRQGIGPWFIRFRYYRYLEHVGVSEDFKFGYRETFEADPWKQRDCLQVQRERLLAGGISLEEVSGLEAEVRGMVERSRQKAQRAPFADSSTLSSMVYG